MSNSNQAALRMIYHEARALLSRVDSMRSFADHTPMVPAAAIPLSAQIAIENHLYSLRRKMRVIILRFIRWLESPEGKGSQPTTAHRKFAILRMRFISILAQLDIFANVLNQRSEHDTGVFLSGIDAFAADALTLPGEYYQTLPVICFLERGPGAAIRRAHTKLPGGDPNPVSVIHLPRERMVGSGIGSSIVHEVGHQGAALLGLVESLLPVLRKAVSQAGTDRLAWTCYERWISEIIADFWAVARLGISAPLGLMTVVSLPKSFVFRVDLHDPHPAPWIRVKLSCAMGNALYPHPQWGTLAKMWEAYYPLEGLDAQRRETFNLLERTIPDFIKVFMNHRPRSLRGMPLKEVICFPDRRPESLRVHFRNWKNSPMHIRSIPPTLALAVIGQARFDGVIAPEKESRVIENLLRYWALQITLDPAAVCSQILHRQDYAISA